MSEASPATWPRADGKWCPSGLGCPAPIAWLGVPRRYEDAFSLALSAANVDVVCWLCTQLEASIMTQVRSPSSPPELYAITGSCRFGTAPRWFRRAAAPEDWRQQCRRVILQLEDTSNPDFLNLVPF